MVAIVPVVIMYLIRKLAKKIALAKTKHGEQEQLPSNKNVIKHVPLKLHMPLKMD